MYRAGDSLGRNMSDSVNSVRLRQSSDELSPERHGDEEVGALDVIQGHRGGSALDPGDASCRHGRRNRRIEREANALFQGLIEKGLDTQEAVDVFRYGLEMFDDGYKSALKAQRLVRAMRNGFAMQGSDKESRGVARAVQDVVFAGAKSWGYSKTEAAAMLGMGRKRMKLTASSSCGSSTRESFFAPRQKNKNAFGDHIKRAVAEFAYCYCKFEEKRFVSTLPSVAVWRLYCQYHDSNGGFYPMGRYRYSMHAWS